MRLLSTQPFVKSNATRLFLTSCTILFFELICIRWIPAYVRYVGYFSNFILLSSVLGVGLGVLLGRRSWKFPPFAFLLIALVVVVRVNRLELKIDSTDVLYYGAGEGPYLHLPIIGSGNPRDYSGRIVDYALDPLTWVGYAYNVSEINTARAGLEAIDTRARNLEAIDELKKGSVDFYATVRSLYRQHRNDLIRNGESEQQASQEIITDEMIPEDGDVPVDFKAAQPEDQVTVAE